MELHKTNEKSEPEKENGRIEIAITDPVVASINQILGQVSSYSSYVSIYRVPEPLRSINPKAYTPTLISIGSFHSARKDLMANKHKPIFLRKFLDFTKLTIDTIIEKVKTLKERAQNCYAESIEMSSDKFVQLLVLDGCFVVMYLISFKILGLQATTNSANLWKFGNEISCDLLLLENQLPFFLLQSLYDLCASTQPLLEGTSFIDLVRRYFIEFYDEDGLDFPLRNVLVNACEVNHFVDFLRMHFTRTCSPKCPDDERFLQHMFWSPTAIELHQCGIFFKTKKDPKKCVMDIAFKDHSGYLELPQINIYDGFEARVRNLIAYEQCHASNMNNEVANFAVFLQCLVQTNQDVKLLIEDGVIHNNLGSINEVTQLFNNLCKQVTIAGNFYNHECKNMREYCKRRRHRWITSLKRNYFSTPWACASSTAAILLLALTFVQTIATLVALYK